ncbi:MAG TPA: HAD family hydrolase [Candidatus Polarisedimenticolaceae bacterium]|nr:HAD family hydrolase [Candidatus Polarisedimenticolaceae bacterium]
MPPIRTVLLDAGGVLLDLDYAYIGRLLASHGVQAERPVLAAAEAVARQEIHRHVSGGGRTSEAWRDYFHSLLGRVGLPAIRQPQVIDTLWEAHARFGLWTAPVAGGPATAAALKRAGFRLGVVSNAEGRVARDLDGAGYAGLFETVVDSHLVGVEKPDPAIFRIALERLGADAASTAFLGDVPAVDVAGARAAGLTPLLLDRHDLYADLPVVRLRAIEELPACLAGLA